jgi:hypothetical protein
MRLIKECTEDVRYLTEEDAKTGRKSLYIEGIFMQSERPNKNRRQYPFSVLDRAVRQYTESHIKPNRAYGELGHPDTPSINLERVSHMIKELRADGTDFYGKAKILDTPYGKIVQNLLDEGAKIAVSTRGLGTLVSGSNGVSLVQDDFQLATAADIVADPSAPDAFVSGIMENKEWILVDGKYTSRDIEYAHKEIDRTPSRRLQETMLRLFDGYLYALSGKRQK